MKLKFLGTRGYIEPSAPYHSHYSGLLIDDKILFDLGEKEFLEYEPEYIFITHLHPDHAFFVEEENISIDVPLYGPEENEKANITIISDTVTINSYEITPFPTIHSKLVKSVAYLIEKKKRILYSGDLIWINKEYHNQLHNLDLVITDGSFIRKGGMIRRDDEGTIYGHKGIPGLVRLFSRFTEHVIFTHFGSWFYKDMQEGRKKMKKLSKKVKIEAAYDGMELVV
ncbi:MAG: hypothetical protein GF308_14400 [Candidatus Heimdallarchaeota archaeon]|nr:hypothetical protein [Candidatus Heimdallarchaeota archaeon]